MAWPKFTWDAAARQYRGADGKFVPRRAVRQALDEAIEQAKARIALDARLLQAGAINLPEWQIRTEASLKTIHVMSAAVAAGGWAQATSADWARAGSRLAKQYKFLERFARQIESGAQPLDGRFLTRAESYAVAGSGTYEAVLRRIDLKTGLVTEERRVLHSANPCTSCYGYHALGWQKPGTLPDIGEDCECGYRCQCTFQRRSKKAPAAKVVEARAPKLPPPPPKVPRVAALPPPPKSAPPRPPKPPRVAPPPPEIAPPTTIPAPPAAPPGDLRSVIASMPGGLRPSEQRAIVADWIEANATRQAVLVQKHGMTAPQPMVSIEFDGLRLHFPEGSHRTMTSAVVGTVRGLAQVPPLPARLAAAARDVYFTDQRNSADDSWAQRYSIPGFRSAATGGDGDIVAYNGHSIGAHNLAHETGHNLATRIYGRTTPPSGSAFELATRGESPPTEYASKSPSEDFAVSVELYVNEPERLRRVAPRRYEALRQLMEGTSSG